MGRVSGCCYAGMSVTQRIGVANVDILYTPNRVYVRLNIAFRRIDIAHCETKSRYLRLEGQTFQGARSMLLVYEAKSDIHVT